MVLCAAWSALCAPAAVRSAELDRTAAQPSSSRSSLTSAKTSSSRTSDLLRLRVGAGRDSGVAGAARVGDGVDTAGEVLGDPGACRAPSAPDPESPTGVLASAAPAEPGPTAKYPRSVAPTPPVTSRDRRRATATYPLRW